MHNLHEMQSPPRLVHDTNTNCSWLLSQLNNTTTIELTTTGTLSGINPDALSWKIS